MNTTTFKTEEKKLTITRTFNAPLDLVWKAWTNPDFLDKWWAPKPMQSKTKSMDFKDGGSRLYAMVALNGDEHWAITFYKEIMVNSYFKGEHAFCDENAKINTEFPVGKFCNKFITLNESQTTVVRELTYTSEEHLKKMVEIGMKEGTSMIFENLDEYLKSFK